MQSKRTIARKRAKIQFYLARTLSGDRITQTIAILTFIWSSSRLMALASGAEWKSVKSWRTLVASEARIVGKTCTLAGGWMALVTR